MPVRRRRTRRHRLALTVGDYIDLSIGPREDTGIERLRGVFEAHRRAFGGDSWAVRYFDHGEDPRAQGTEDERRLERIEAEVIEGTTELSELEHAVGLPGPLNATSRAAA